MTALRMDFPPELLEQIAERAAKILLEKQGTGANTDEWLRGADQIASYLGCSTSRVYSLNSARRLPVQKDGSAIVARRSDLDAWIEGGGEVCP